MSLSKEGYPKGLLIRAVWDCCDDLYSQLNRPPTHREFKDEIARREPGRVNKSTHSRQWVEWIRHHGFTSSGTLNRGEIPDEYLQPQILRVHYAVKVLKCASARDIMEWIRKSNAPLKETEIKIQLDALTVNSNSRHRYSGSRKVKRTDRGHPYDALFRTGTYRSTRYEEYVPELHGVWDIAEDGKTPVRIVEPTHADELTLEIRDEVFTEAAEAETTEDMRVTALREAVIREGQPAFRRRLLEAYEGKCAVTGCTISALLEAAHIIPYAGAWHTKAQHGLLLKTDIHTLFDKGLLWFDDELKVCLAPVLLDSEYAVYLGNKLALPELKEHWPLQDHLTRHRLFFSKAGNIEES